MSAELRPIPVAKPDDILPHLRGAAILLSASVPYLRKEDEHEDDEARKRNQRYVDLRRTQSIRLAVVELTKTALQREVQLIFGAHPAISPMVLDAARNMGAPPGSLLIFQSDFFADKIPNSTYELANWSSGRMLMTPHQEGRDKREAERLSLATMRKLMTNSPNLCGAVFVGGMEGVEAEAALFDPPHRPLPLYAIASTGSAAKLLFDRSPEKFRGRGLAPDLLEKSSSYALLARQILDDMEIPEPRSDSTARGG